MNRQGKFYNNLQVLIKESEEDSWPEYIINEVLKIASDQISFQSYCRSDHSELQGVHEFLFRVENLTDEQWEKLDNFCQQHSDDGQARGCLIHDIGDIWFIFPWSG